MYKKSEHVSHSSLSALNVSPRYFQKYKARELYKDSKALDLGSAIHCYVLEKEYFEDRYAVSFATPVGGMMGIFIEAYVEGEQTMISEHMPEQLKLDGYVTLAELCYDKSGFKTALETVLKKFNSDENQAYFKFLKENLGKVILSQDDMQIVLACYKSLTDHNKANSLLFPKELENLEYKPEFEISWAYGEINVKSIIDNLILDVENKKIYIVDLKTSAKSIYNFERSYFSYNYYRQMAIYKLAVISYLKTLGMDLQDYDIYSYIVVVQTTGLHECIVYKPDVTDLSIGMDEFDSLIHRYKWHMNNNQWEFPMEYYKNDGVINLKLSDEYISRITENK